MAEHEYVKSAVTAVIVLLRKNVSSAGKKGIGSLRTLPSPSWKSTETGPFEINVSTLQTMDMSSPNTTVRSAAVAIGLVPAEYEHNTYDLK